MTVLATNGHWSARPKPNGQACSSHVYSSVRHYKSLWTVNKHILIFCLHYLPRDKNYLTYYKTDIFEIALNLKKIYQILRAERLIHVFKAQCSYGCEVFLWNKKHLKEEGTGFFCVKFLQTSDIPRPILFLFLRPLRSVSSKMGKDKFQN